MTEPPAGDQDDRDRAVDHAGRAPEVDRAVRVILPESFAEVAGAVLMDLLGPFELESTSGASATGAAGDSFASDSATASGAVARLGGGEKAVTLVFYPDSPVPPGVEDVLAMLPSEVAESGRVMVETRDASRDWVKGWRDHFHPIVVGGVRIRPPWEPALRSPGAAPGAMEGAADGAAPDGAPPVDVVINPGLGFGTGLHPTTRGTLQLLQLAQAHGKARRQRTTSATRGRTARRGERASGGTRGRLVDVGTGSGILAIAAAKLGWGPIIAFDNDPMALVSARENLEANAVEGVVEAHLADVTGAAAEWFAGATVLANMTLKPVLTLVRRLGGAASPAGAKHGTAWDPAAAADRVTWADLAAGLPLRLVVSGILAGAQEYELLGVAQECGFVPGQRLYEAEWVSLELLPALSGGSSADGLPGARLPRGGAPAGGDEA